MKINRAVVKVLAILGVAVLLPGRLLRCGETVAFVPTQDIMQALTKENEVAGNSSTPEPEQENVALTGAITMAGSTSMEKLANALAESFMAKYPGVTVTAEFTGSSAGIESMLAGSVDIGNSSRSLSEEEKSSGAVENVVAIDGIAVITDTSNAVTNLDIEQLTGIYMGEVRNWSEVGGSNEAIVVVGREAGCGTRDSFEALLEVKDMCAYANELNSSGVVIAKVAATPGAIGYVSLDVLDDTVRAMSLDGIEPTEENISAGSYLLRRPFVMATHGAISAQSKAVQQMFAYLKSEEGQELIGAVGLIVPD